MEEREWTTLKFTIEEYLGFKTQEDLILWEFILDRSFPDPQESMETIYKRVYKHILSCPLHLIPLYINHPDHSIRHMTKKRLSEGGHPSYTIRSTVRRRPL